MSKIPFRVELHVGHDKRAADHLLTGIGKASDLPRIPIDIEYALAHPDERIPIAIIRRWAWQLRNEHRKQLYQRSLETCEIEGIVWHPLLDAMTHFACWPLPENPKEKKGKIRLSGVPSEAIIEKQIQPLLEWLETTEDLDAIKALSTFRSYTVLERAGRHLGKITNETIDLFPLPGIARNPRLDEGMANRIAERAVEWLVNPARRSWVTKFGDPVTQHAVQTLEGLTSSGRRIPTHLIERLIEAQVSEDEYQHCIHALQAIGAQVSERQLEKTLDRASGASQLRILITHPSATPAFQLKVLKRAERESYGVLDLLRAEISRNPSSVADPNIRNNLLRSRSGAVLEQTIATAADADDDVFLSILNRFTKNAPAVAVMEMVKDKDDNATSSWKKRVRERHLTEFIEGIVRSNNFKALIQLLYFEPTMNDPRIQEAIIHHTKTDSITLRRVARLAKGEQFRKAFGRLLRDFPVSLDVILNFLETEKPVGLLDLRPEDFAPLLQSEKYEIRLHGITLLSELRKKQAKTTEMQSPQHNDFTRNNVRRNERGSKTKRHPRS